MSENIVDLILESSGQHLVSFIQNKLLDITGPGHKQGLNCSALDPQDFDFLDPDPQKNVDPRGKISTKNSQQIFFTPKTQPRTFEKKTEKFPSILE